MPSGRSTRSTSRRRRTGSRSTPRRGGRPRPRSRCGRCDPVPAPRARPERRPRRRRSSRCARAAAPVPIPLGGAVLVAVGAAAAALTAEAPVGQQVIDAPDLQAGLAGCRLGDRRRPSDRPQRSARVPGRRGVHDEPARHRGPHAPGSDSSRTGAIILVAVDGRQPGYSVGMTNFELAQALVRLGAVTGMALDGGGSTTMAFDGSLLNRPSGAERPISTALLLQYTGVFVQPAVAVVSPDGDGVADRQTLRYKVVKPSTVNVTLVAPNGAVAYSEAVTRRAGQLRRPVPPAPSATRCRTRARVHSHRGANRSRAADPGQVEADRVGDRRRGAAVRDEPDVPRQHDGRLPREQPEEALPATRRPRPPHRVEADEGGAGRRHRRDCHG